MKFTDMEIRSMRKRIFATDPSYKLMIAMYRKTDALLATGVYLCLILMYLVAGYLLMTSGSILPAILVNILLMAIVLLVVRIRKQKLSTVGFTFHNFKRALIVGTATGLIFSVCGNIIPTILSGGEWTGWDSILWNFFYMLINIALIEELVFRGYIQTRLYGVFKSDVSSIIVGGLLFMGSHIPFQLFNRNGGNIIEFISGNYLWLFSTFVIHLFFNFLYRKYNSLTASTASHFLMNFGSTLFQ
jgi:membrane protease YdiL (CAAX protease family)